MSPLHLGTIRNFPLTVPRWAPGAHVGIGVTLAVVVGCVNVYNSKPNERPTTWKGVAEYIGRMAKAALICASAMLTVGLATSIAIEAMAKLCGRISVPPLVKTIGTGLKNGAHVLLPVLAVIAIILVLEQLKNKNPI